MLHGAVFVMMCGVLAVQSAQQRFIELPFGEDAPTRRDFANEQNFQTFQQAAFAAQPSPAPAPAPARHDDFPEFRRFPPAPTRGAARHPARPALPVFQDTQQQEAFDHVPRTPELTEHELRALNSVSQPQPHRPEHVPANAFFAAERPSQKPHIRRPVPARFDKQPFIINEQPAFAEPKFQPTNIAPSQRQQQQDYEEQLFRHQAASAKYSFASDIDDAISGNQHQRQETRDGTAVKGKYSYSDGYVKRTVHYEADEKGYRVVKEEEEPLGNGPQVDPNGQANVSTFVAGNQLQYSITGADIQDPQKNLTPQVPQQKPQRSLRHFA